MKRRAFLQGTLAGSVASFTAGGGLLALNTAQAAEETQAHDPFESSTLEEALEALEVSPEESSEISLTVPEIAENGAVVPVNVKTSLSDVTEIAVVVPQNPTTVAAVFKLNEKSTGAVSTRIKMGETSDVIAVVKAGDKAYMTKQEVKVTVGGCGG